MGSGDGEREGEKEHVRRREMYTVRLCLCVCVFVSVISERMCLRRLLYDHTPTGACECPLADRHTHVARWERWGTNENAILLTDMPKHTTCNHSKDVFLRVSTSNCFKQMSDLWLRVCNLLDAGWRAGNLSGRVKETQTRERQKESKKHQWDWHPCPPPASALFFCGRYQRCLPWAVKTAW